MSTLTVRNGALLLKRFIASPSVQQQITTKLPQQIRCISSTPKLLVTMYTESHEWVNFKGDGKCTVGITDHAQNELGDIVYVELPELDTELEQDDPFAVVESVKAASDINSPVGGVVTAINEAVAEDPALINKDAGSQGWLIELDCGDDVDKDHLLSEEAYQELIA